MRRAVRLATFVTVLLAVFVVQIPGWGQAQTGSEATPETGAGFTIETIGSSERVAALGGRSDRRRGQLSHYLLRVTLQPGATLPEASEVPSVLIHLDSGRIQVSPSAGEEIRVEVGRGEAISSPDDRVVCKEGGCDLAPGQEVLLGPGNSISLKQSSFIAQALEGEPVVLNLGLLEVDDPSLCYICPQPPRR